MGALQTAFEKLLHGEVIPPLRTVPVVRRDDFVRGQYLPHISQIYERLGGLLAVFEFRMPRWDLEYDGVAIELDEALHFNRYRIQTLGSPLYKKLPAFPSKLYQKFCRAHEDACLRAGSYGGKWSNKSCIRQFGAGAQPGDLKGGGAPRWQQRAFYDFIKDVAPLAIGVKVARVSIYDRVRIGSRARTVEEVLLAPRTSAARKSLLALVRERGA